MAASTTVNQLSLEYPFEELQQATHDFCGNLRLGYGSFGGVFRGIQKDGTEVAIKVLDVGDEGGFEEEVRVLSKFRHPNLVILMGFARHGPQRFLVYEHLAGGDVFRRLQRCAQDNVPFTWRERLSVAFDASCGLSHLHNASPKVFHRDIKCPNILLDRNGTAKIADFGLACCSHYKEQKVQQAAGTVGYACPHYVNKGVVTEGSEVYSFGIVLLELLTAAQPAYQLPTQAPDGGVQYCFLVSQIGNDVRVAVQMADAKAKFPGNIAQSFAALGLRCTDYTEECRPLFREIVTKLRALLNTPEAPAPPPPPEPEASARPTAPQRPHEPQSFQDRHGYQSPLELQGFDIRGNRPQAFDGRGYQPPQLQGLDTLPGFHPSSEEERRPSVHRQASAQERFQGISVQVNLLSGPPSPASLQLAPGAGRPLGPGFPPLQPGLQAPSRALLWSLECVKSECSSDLSAKPKDQRVLAHWRDMLPYDRDMAHALPHYRFGRLFQNDFCRVMLPNDHFFSQVSREHFQIWAQEWPDLGFEFKGQPCSFFLTNFGTVGTVVDGQVLDTKGQQAALHHGSRIALLRNATDNGRESKVEFLEFIFSLEGSVLEDADEIYEAVPGSRRSCDAPSGPLLGGVCPSTETERCGDAVQGGMSFAGTDVEPVFVLELGGTALRAGVPRENFRVLHGPSASAIASAPSCEVPCPPLTLGSRLQPGFWKRILTDDARGLLAEQHLRIEVEESLEGPEQKRFYLRNLSELSLKVEGAPEGHDSTRLPDEDGRWQLHDGDSVLLNLCKGSSMWMCFREFAAKAQPI
ncbi:putative serine/threonine-protein kinase [Symbiodinium microadriaticum]|uniref:Putative serine/threonine-protein kinase n=2 Tax=Symbiodinium TaxID=2949 RepID=A0A1Q9CUX4_SYMMI|nr:putative serine/threonine-protein kinase [Symbiodinium microadriaticum]